MAGFASQNGRLRGRGRLPTTLLAALLAHGALACLAGCDFRRRFQASNADPNGGLVHAGEYYGDSGKDAGAVPPWDTLTVQFSGKPIAADGGATGGEPALPLPCGGATPKPDNTCCAAGLAWNSAANSCVEIALAECSDPATCAPLWCASWQAFGGTQCAPADPGCTALPKPCSPDEIAAQKACRAGMFSPSGGFGNSCVAAGSSVTLPGGAPLPPDGSLPALDPLPADLIPADVLAPALETPLWCFASADAATACPANASSCAVGTVVQTQGKGGCTPLASALPPWCPAGFVTTAAAVPDCLADLADCGSDPWGGIAETGANVFVDPAFAGAPKGSKAAPFVSIDAALAKLGPAPPAGTVVALAAGTYTLGTPGSGSVTIPAGVTVRGRCAASTTLVGSSNSADPHGIVVAGGLQRVLVKAGSVTVKPGGNLQRTRIEGVGWFPAALQIAGGAVQDVVVAGGDKPGAVADAKGGSATVSGLRILGVKERGLVVAGGFSLQAANVVVTGTNSAADLQAGNGILVAEAAQLQLDGARVVGNASAGISVFDSGSTLTANRVAVTGTLPSAKDKTVGHGLQVSGGAAAKIDHAFFDQNRTVAVIAYGTGSKITGSNWTVTGTLPQGSDQTLGDGVRAQAGGAVQVFGIVVQNSRHYGAMCSGAGSKLDLAQAQIATTQPQASDQTDGMGLWIDAGCQAKLGDVRLDNNRAAGLVAVGAGTVVNAGTLTVTAMLPQQSDSKKGFGLQVVEGAKVSAALLHVDMARTAALWMADKGTVVQLGAFKALRTQPEVGGFGGRGAHVAAGAELKVAGPVRIFNSSDVGVLADGAGTEVYLGNGKDAAWIAATLPRADGWSGRGISVQNGAMASVNRLHVQGGRDAGVAVSGAGSSLQAKDLWITDVQARMKDGLFGRCVAVEDQAAATISGLHAYGCTDAGVFAHRGTLNGSDWTIAKIATAPAQAPGSPTKGGVHGRGLVLQGGTVGALQRVRVSQAHDVGVFAASSKDGETFFNLRALTVDATLPDDATGATGRGLELAAGATLTVSGAYLTGNRSAAVMLSGGGARLYANDLWINGTQAGKDPAAGIGVAVLDKAVLFLAGARMTQNLGAGLLVDAATAKLAGVLVGNTQSGAGGWAGFGAVVQNAGSLDAFGLRADHNRGAALLNVGAHLALNRAIAIGTQFAKGLTASAAVFEFADAVQAVAALQMTISNAVLQANQRTGLLADATLAQLVGVRVSGNGFGFAVQNAAKLAGTDVASDGNDSNVWTGAALPVAGSLPLPLPSQQMDPQTY